MNFSKCLVLVLLTCSSFLSSVEAATIQMTGGTFNSLKDGSLNAAWAPPGLSFQATGNVITHDTYFSLGGGYINVIDGYMTFKQLDGNATVDFVATTSGGSVNFTQSLEFHYENTIDLGFCAYQIAGGAPCADRISFNWGSPSVSIQDGAVFYNFSNFRVQQSGGLAPNEMIIAQATQLQGSTVNIAGFAWDTSTSGACLTGYQCLRTGGSVPISGTMLLVISAVPFLFRRRHMR